MKRTTQSAIPPSSLMRISSESRKLTRSNGQQLPALAREASLIHRKPRSRRSRGTIRLYDA